MIKLDFIDCKGKKFTSYSDEEAYKSSPMNNLISSHFVMFDGCSVEIIIRKDEHICNHFSSISIEQFYNGKL